MGLTQVLSVWKCLGANVRAKDVSGQGCCRAEGTGRVAQDASRWARSLPRPLGAGTGLRCHQPPPGRVSRHAAVPGPRPSCQGRGALGSAVLSPPARGCPSGPGLQRRAAQGPVAWRGAQTCLGSVPVSHGGSVPALPSGAHLLPVPFVLRPEAGTSPLALPARSAAGGAAVRQHLQAEPRGLRQLGLWQELLVWARFLLFWSLSRCLCCRTRLGWPGQPAPAEGPWRPGGKSKAGRSWAFPPGRFLGCCSWGVYAAGTGCGSQAGRGGAGCFWQCPSERPPGSLSERILASAWGLDTVLGGVLSWRTPCSTTACGAGAGGQSPGPAVPLAERCQDLCPVPVALKGTQRTVRGGTRVRGEGRMRQ